jgi:hypothetical protein
MRYLVLLIAALFLSLEPSAAQAQTYGDPNSLVDYWYRTYLGRTPDPSGIVTWVNALNQGTPPDAVLASILGSDEYYQRAGSTPEGFISQLFNDLLHRSPRPGDLDFWVRRMYTEDRRAIAADILTQNPGVWVGSNAVVTPPAGVAPNLVVTPGIEVGRYRDWDRDRRWDWDRHHDIHEYRRPYYYRPYEHHEDEHHR